MKKLNCWLIGHSEDHMDPYGTRCFRCGFEWDYGEDVRSDLGFWLSYYNFKANLWLRPLRDWLKCPDCKGRCGRHNPDCMPF